VLKGVNLGGVCLFFKIAEGLRCSVDIGGCCKGLPVLSHKHLISALASELKLKVAKGFVVYVRAYVLACICLCVGDECGNVCQSISSQYHILYIG